MKLQSLKEGQMSKISLEKLRENGTLDFLYKNGFISFKIFGYIDAYQAYKQFKLQGLPQRECTEMAAEKCGCSEATIFRAIRFLKMAENGKK